MGKQKKRKRREEAANSQSNTSASDNSALELEQPVLDKNGTVSNVTELTVNTPVSVRESLSAFKFVPTKMASRGDDRSFRGDSSNDRVATPNDRTVSNEDLMLKLDDVLTEVGANGSKILKLSDTVEDLRGKIFQLEQEHVEMKEQIRRGEKREHELSEMFEQACYVAELADRKSEDTAAYVRRNNLRVYGVKEGATDTWTETQQQCETKVLDLFRVKLQVNVCKEDIEAVHRLGPRQKTRNSPRGIIVRFISRCIRDQVIYARRKLSGTGVVIVEDLTPRGYAMLNAVKDDREVCCQAWSKNGKIFMKAFSGEIIQIQRLSDLRSDQKKRQRWATRPASGSSWAPGSRSGSGQQGQPRGTDQARASRPAGAGGSSWTSDSRSRPQEQPRGTDQSRVTGRVGSIRGSSRVPSSKSRPQMQPWSTDRSEASRTADRGSSSDSVMSTGGGANSSERATGGAGHSVAQAGGDFQDSVAGTVISSAAESQQSKSGAVPGAREEGRKQREPQELTILGLFEKVRESNIERLKERNRSNSLDSVNTADFVDACVEPGGL